MYRRPVSTIPLLVGAVVFVLSSSAFGAQQEHNHSAPAESEHACACCGNSGADAMNHAKEGGCCPNMAAMNTSKSEDNTAKSEDGGCCADKAAHAGPAMQMKHEGHGCCGSMARDKSDASATPTEEEAPSIE